MKSSMRNVSSNYTWRQASTGLTEQERQLLCAEWSLWRRRGDPDLGRVWKDPQQWREWEKKKKWSAEKKKEKRKQGREMRAVPSACSVWFLCVPLACGGLVVPSLRRDAWTPTQLIVLCQLSVHSSVSQAVCRWCSMGTAFHLSRFRQQCHLTRCSSAIIAVHHSRTYDIANFEVGGRDFLVPKRDRGLE